MMRVAPFLLFFNIFSGSAHPQQLYLSFFKLCGNLFLKASYIFKSYKILNKGSQQLAQVVFSKICVSSVTICG